MKFGIRIGLVGDFADAYPPEAGGNKVKACFLNDKLVDMWHHTVDDSVVIEAALTEAFRLGQQDRSDEIKKPSIYANGSLWKHYAHQLEGEKTSLQERIDTLEVELSTIRRYIDMERYEQDDGSYHYGLGWESPSELYNALTPLSEKER
jgi:hypothetical protein